MAELRRRVRTILLVDVEVDGRCVDVLVTDGTVREVGVGLSRPTGAEVVHGAGGALLPGLVDHHIHLLATAAAASSVVCGPPEVRNAAALRIALSHAVGDDWVRGTGYHDSVAGPLDRALLDDLVPDRPARVQHRSGGLWILNTRALQAVGIADVPDGRVWRSDERLRSGVGAETPVAGRRDAGAAARRGGRARCGRCDPRPRAAGAACTGGQ